MGERTLTVERDRERLDAFLAARLPALSRRVLRRVIAEGAVRVNGRRAVKGFRLHAGDRVTVPDLPERLMPEPELALRIVYEDADLVALDKPGGIPSHALEARQHGTAAAFLLARYPEMAGVGDPLAPGLVHRLDTGTSGLLLAARHAEAHAVLRTALRARRVEKRYLAVVVGAGGEALHTTPLSHDPRDRRRMVPAVARARAWPAETRVVVVRRGAERSLVEATIRTGVTHQVRVHLAQAGHPVVGDVLYGGPPADLPPGRHALHASALSLPHPRDGRALAIASPLPAELAGLVG